MLPIVSIVGRPGSGKSRLIESLTDLIEKNGRRLAVIRQGDNHGYAAASMKVLEGALDLVLVDGICNESDPRIEVRDKDLLTEPDKLLAVVSDTDPQVDCPHFVKEDPGTLAAYIERKLLENGSRGTVLLVNGKPVPLSPFPQDMITTTVTGMVSSLKGVGEVRSVSIITRNESGPPCRQNGGDD